MPAAIPLYSRVVRREGAVPVTSAWDRTVPYPGNAIGRPLLATHRLNLRPGDRRIVQIEYARPAAMPRLAPGDRIAILVSMPGGTARVAFRVAAE